MLAGPVRGVGVEAIKKRVDFRLFFAHHSRMLSDKEAEEIRSSVEGGTRGPVLLKWIRQLLEDRDERVRRERDVAGRRPPGTEDGAKS